MISREIKDRVWSKMLELAEAKSTLNDGTKVYPAHITKKNGYVFNPPRERIKFKSPSWPKWKKGEVTELKPLSLDLAFEGAIHVLEANNIPY